MSTTNLEAALASTRTVLAGVVPAQLDDPTPCSNWSVRDLINHIVGAQGYFVSIVDGTGSDDSEPDFAAGDFLATYDGAAATTMAAFVRPGVMETTFDLAFGPTPGSALMNIATTDAFQHGWDLARATGQDVNLDPALAAQLLDGLHTTLPDAARNEAGDPFGPRQEAPAGASPADQLAAFLGRTV